MTELPNKFKRLLSAESTVLNSRPVADKMQYVSCHTDW